MCPHTRSARMVLGNWQSYSGCALDRKEQHMSSSRWSTMRIPAPEVFYLEVPLYAGFCAVSGYFKEVLRIEFFQGTLDAYCLQCKRESVFRSKAYLPKGRRTEEAVFQSVYPRSLEDFLENFSRVQPSPPDGPMLKLQTYAAQDRRFSLQFACTRDPAHLLIFVFRVQGDEITKIGQSPSLADFQMQEIGKYRKILGDSKYRELHRAVGLSAHGVGIGAFVYLRRIFEGLVEAARDEAAKKTNWDKEKQEKFETSRWDEKILMLKDSLPSFLVENRTIYSILSKGIHSLTEEECLKHFAPLRLGIELILDEKIEQEEKAKKIARARKDLDSIKSELA